MAIQKLTPSSAAQWRAIGEYTAAEAACLLLNLEPQGDSLQDITGASSALARRILKRFSLTDPKTLPVFIDMDNPKSPPRTITLEQMAVFATEAGFTDALVLGTVPANPDPEPTGKGKSEYLLMIAILARMATLDIANPHGERCAHKVLAEVDRLRDAGEWPDRLRDPKGIATKIEAAEATLRSLLP